jgi:hypothetical protein
MVSVDTLRLLALRAKIDSEARKLNSNTIQDARLIASVRAGPTIGHWMALTQSSERRGAFIQCIEMTQAGAILRG